MKKLKPIVLALILTACLVCAACSDDQVIQDNTGIENEVTQSLEVEKPESSDTAIEAENEEQLEHNAEQTPTVSIFDLSNIPTCSGNPYVEVNDNTPQFNTAEITATSFESYSPLDSLGRCGTALACVGLDIMPTEERGSIGEVKPSGWHLSTYDKSVIADRYLYNRCHLIGYQLSGENANELNLITGTRYLNIEGMLPFENEIANYVEHTGNHVMYRVTPVFEGNNLVASGVHMEAYSVEDKGKGVSFNVFCYNVQPNIEINYATGDNWLITQNPTTTETSAEITTAEKQTEKTYVLNTNTHKFHHQDCSSVSKMKEKNKELFTGTRDEVVSQGYDPCGNCNP